MVGEPAALAIGGANGDDGRGRKGALAHVVSRFPKVSETFILNEIVELERRGLHVEVFSLMREHAQVRHPQAKTLAERAHYATGSPRALVAAQLKWLRRRPVRYLSLWRASLRGNLGSPKFLVRVPAAVAAGALFALELEALDVRHIHAHYATHPALTAYAMSVLTGIPYSFTAHAHDIYVERPMLGEKIAGAEFVVTISDYNKRLLEQLYGDLTDNKLFVIHCGVETSHFAAPGEPRSGERPFTIVCVASLEEYKGHRYLLDACAELLRDGHEFELQLIGDGEDRASIEDQIARLGLGRSVRVLGAQPRERVRDLLAAADAAVLASVVTADGKKEGIPVALMEALAMRVPVVATGISGIPELIEDERTGLLVPERDSSALAAALARIDRDPSLGERLAKAGSEKVLKEFDQAVSAARLDALISAAGWGI